MKKQKEKHILTNQQGFTLAELLVVVAIIGILVAISVPVFAAQLERSREATDMANVRVAYAEVLTAVNSGDVNESRIVPLKQKEDGWQTPRKVMIGGITRKTIQITGSEIPPLKVLAKYTMIRLLDPYFNGAGNSVIYIILLTTAAYWITSIKHMVQTSILKLIPAVQILKW